MTKPTIQTVYNPFFEKIMFCTYTICAASCLYCSAFYHTVSCHSEHVYCVFQQLDFAGIAILITGSYLPYLYYIWYCVPFWQTFHSLMIAGLGCFVIGFTQSKIFTEQGKKLLRSWIFIGYGGFSVIPMCHAFYVFGWRGMFFDFCFGELLAMGALYLIGVAIYINKVPERCFPGRFDCFFHSHSIFHIFVVMAILVYMIGMTGLRNNRLAMEDSNCSGFQ